MAKVILIELRAEDKASAKIKATEQAVTNLGKNTKASMDTSQTAVKDTVGQLEGLGNRFRYLSMVTSIFAASTVMMAKSFVDSVRELETATLRLGVFAVSSGQSMEEAKEAALDLASTGLISVTEASESLSNLLALQLNMSVKEATVLAKRMLDSTVLLKQNINDTYGVAMKKGTLGVRVMREALVDSIGVEALHMQLYKDYKKEIGAVGRELTIAEKQQAIVNNLMKETERTLGGADLMASTFSGSMQKLNASFIRAKAALGETLVPLVGTFSELLNNVTKSVGNFAQANASLTSILISGIVVFGTLIAMVATLGALIPMLVRGFQGLSAAGLFMMTTAGLKTLAVVLALSVAIGGLIYLALKATGQWDKWRTAMSSLTQRIKDSINPFKQAGEASTEAAEKLAKQLKKLQENIVLATRDFTEGMAEWAQKHDETVKDLRKQIGDLQKDYSEATSKIRKDFKDAMSDLELSHSRKTEDLQRELEEEVSKGIWADQTRIRDIRLSLKRENEDYARSTQEKVDGRDEDLADEKTKLDERLIKLQADLDKELELEQKHALLVATARTWPILDELEKRTRAYDERLKQYNDELIEIQSSSNSEADALGNVGDAFEGISNAVEKFGEKVDDASKKFTGFFEGIKSYFPDSISKIALIASSILGIRAAILLVDIALKTTIGTQLGVWFLNLIAVGGAARAAIASVGLALASLPMTITIAIALAGFATIMGQISSLKREYNDLNNSLTQGAALQNQVIQMWKNQLAAGKITQAQYIEKLKTLNNNTTQDLGGFWSNFSAGLQGMLNFANGGVIPGPMFQPVPIMAHGGETVLPAGLAPITVNVNNPVVRDEQDIMKIADAVKTVLSRQQYLKHLQ